MVIDRERNNYIYIFIFNNIIDIIVYIETQCTSSCLMLALFLGKTSCFVREVEKQVTV